MVSAETTLSQTNFIRDGEEEPTRFCGADGGILIGVTLNWFDNTLVSSI